MGDYGERADETGVQRQPGAGAWAAGRRGHEAGAGGLRSASSCPSSAQQGDDDPAA